MIKVQPKKILLPTSYAVNVMLWVLVISVAYFVVRGLYATPTVNQLIELCRVQSAVQYVPSEYAAMMARIAELEGRQHALFALFGEDVEKRLMELGFTKGEIKAMTGSGGKLSTGSGSASSR